MIKGTEIYSGEAKAHGEIFRHKMVSTGSTWIEVCFDVDILYDSNMTKVYFWGFCYLNDLIEKEPDENGKFSHKINHANLILSKDENKNQEIERYMDRLGIFIPREFEKEDEEEIENEELYI